MRFSLSVVSALAGLTIASAADAQSALYIGGSAGASFMSDRGFGTTFHSGTGMTSPGSATTSFDPGATLDGAVGLHLPLGFRVEGELGWVHNDVDSTTVNPSNPAFPVPNGTKFTSPSGGERNFITATVNLFYDIPVRIAGIAPYIGAGAGYYHLSANNTVFSQPYTFTGRASDTSGAVVLAEAGLTIPVVPRLAVVPAYRYEHFFNSTEGWNSHQIKVGLRYDF